MDWLYAVSPRLFPYSMELREPREILIRFSLYQRMPGVTLQRFESPLQLCQFSYVPSSSAGKVQQDKFRNDLQAMESSATPRPASCAASMPKTGVDHPRKTGNPARLSRCERRVSFATRFARAFLHRTLCALHRAPAHAAKCARCRCRTVDATPDTRAPVPS